MPTYMSVHSSLQHQLLMQASCTSRVVQGVSGMLVNKCVPEMVFQTFKN